LGIGLYLRQGSAESPNLGLLYEVIDGIIHRYRYIGLGGEGKTAEKKQQIDKKTNLFMHHILQE
jgi:hypothetical protein